jgi:hypothetical protein
MNKNTQGLQAHHRNCDESAQTAATKDEGMG